MAEPAPRRAPRPPKQKRPKRPFASTLVVLALVTAVTAGLLLYGASRYIDHLPTLDAIKAREIGANSEVYDARGASLGVLANDENRQPITSNQISPWMKKGTVAIEDRRFYQHGGIDPQGIARAIVKNVMAGHIVQGGSTLTQQLISQIYIVKQHTFDRKLREAVLAIQLEDRFTKDEILTAYLNTVFYGNNAYGVEAAAETYFAKPAKDLTLPQAALLSGLPQLPSSYDPYHNPQAALKRRAQVLQAMRETGDITAAQERQANATKLNLKHGHVYGKVAESFFVRYVADELSKNPDIGSAGVRAGGLQITTTLDPKLQAKARSAMHQVLKTTGDPDAAIVSIRPKTGQIVAMASTRYFHKDQFDLASQGRRQPGSTFKPITLATAIEQGIDPSATTYMSAPFSWQPDPNSPVWNVATAGGEYAGPISLENATLASDNTVFAQLAIDVGPANIVDMAKRLGVRTSPLEAVPSLTLGADGVSPLEMATVYATLADGGVYHAPTAIKQVTDADGKLLVTGHSPGVRVVQDGVAAEVTRILGENMHSGTGTGALMSDDRPEAGKTGTTDNHTDAWFCGYTPTLATCVWIGYPDETKPMIGVEGVGAVSGPTLPADIWHIYMDSALGGTPPVSFAAPKTLPSWARFDSQFANRVVSTISAPDLTLTMPPPQTITVTQPPASTAPAATVQAAPTTTAAGGATTAPVP